MSASYSKTSVIGSMSMIGLTVSALVFGNLFANQNQSTDFLTTNPASQKMIRGAKQAPELRNPAQHFVIHFSRNGLALRLGNHTSSKFAMQLQAYKVANHTQSINPANPQVHGNHVELKHGHGITEWYINNPLGLEQGITLAKPLAASGPLTLIFSLQGNLQPMLAKNALILKDSAGNGILRYAGLVAYDASHHRLPARMQLVNHRLLLDVDTKNAQFPVTLDPLFSSMQAFPDPGNPQTDVDYYGSAMALSNDGNTAFVGAISIPSINNRGDGAVFVYSRTNGTWTLTATIRNPEPADSDGDGNSDDDDFGASIALSADGKTAVIGVGTGRTGYYYGEPGAAYIFTETAGTWPITPTVKFIDPNSTGDFTDGFGNSVSISADGTVALISAYGADVGTNDDAGTAYIFTQTGGVWSATPVATFDDPTASAGNEDTFGDSVALSGDGNTAFVSAPNAVVSATSGDGYVYVYTNNNGTWATQPVVTFTDPNTISDDFGTAIALSSDDTTALIRSYSYDSNSNVVYSYTQSSGSWSTTPSGTIIAPANGPHGGDSGGFGKSLALSANGNIALIGEPSAGNDLVPDSAVYLYVRSNGTWSDTPAILADPGTIWGGYGETAALSGDGGTAVIGAERTRANTGDNPPGAGAAYFYNDLSVTPIDLSLAVASSPTSVAAGANVSYMMTVTNPDSSNDDSNLILINTLPYNTTFVSADADGGICTNVDDNGLITVTCTLDSLAANSDWKPSITVTAPGTDITFDTLDDTATLTAGQPDPSSDNNSASVSTTNSASSGSGDSGGSGSSGGSGGTGSTGGDSSSGSGGGTLGLLSLFMLGLPLLKKSRRKAGRD